MEPVNILLLGIALIIFFGVLAEYIFKRIGVPDILLLVFLGFIIGPNLLHWVNPSDFASFAPAFTTFALMYLMFEGSLSIDLGSFTRGLISGSTLSLYNFIISVSAITAILSLFFNFELLQALLVGCILSGVSSAFVIPVIKQINPRGEIYTVLTLEAALTDVYTIVFSLTVLQIIQVQSASFQAVLNQIVSLFAIAALVGLVAALIWIVLDKRMFKGFGKNYMITIAFLILIYILTDYLGGNGAIATMFFGIFLKNSKQITTIINWVKSSDEEEKKKIIDGQLGIKVLTETEQFFFSQISFFIKTFFFVYIGLLLNLQNIWAVVIGVILAVVVMLVRRANFILTKNLHIKDKTLINAIFARGLAAAAVMQIIVDSGVAINPLIVDTTYVFIVSTILLSSISILIYRMQELKAGKAAAAAATATESQAQKRAERHKREV
jgi:potassium/hydrogen antiporter